MRRRPSRVASHPAKLEKIALLAEYLRTLDDADLVAAVRFFSGAVFAARDRRTLSIGGRTLVEVARRVWGFDDAALGLGYRATGDLGAALGSLVRPPRDATLFRDRLTPLRSTYSSARSRRHPGSVRISGARRVLERILRACESPLVATYVVKIVTGDLRVGLREGLVLDAIARAFGAEPSMVRRAAMAAGDVGAVALAAKHDTLAELRVDYGVPIGFMLATPVAYGDVYAELAGAVWHFEDKYDGIRAQAHVRDGAGANIFAAAQRRYGILSRSRKRAARCGSDAIVDGEIVAMRDGRVLPFRLLQARLQRKSVDEALLRDVPIAYVVFDLLALGDELLLDEPLASAAGATCRSLRPEPRTCSTHRSRPKASSLPPT